MDLDTFVFYGFAMCILVIGFLIVDQDTVIGSICGLVVFAIGIFFLFHETGSPIVERLENQALITRILAGFLIVAIGGLIIALSDHPALDALGLTLVAVGLIIVLSTGLANPLIREMQELQTTSEMIQNEN